MDTVSESSMAASASEASPSSTTTTPRSTALHYPLRQVPPHPLRIRHHLQISSDFIDSGWGLYGGGGGRGSSRYDFDKAASFLGAKRGGLGAVGERGGWGGGGCVRCERCGEDSGFPAGAAVVGADGDFMVGAAMGTRFVLAF
ncbi:hypothetical protein Syun_014066 [Stephania yunnanensis]|uniref:Uncharacterized protein n=1 Tax=Stephania yunnanensis TaxID=152371 RepID=A0AAP0JIL4_9MAGN